MGHGRNWLVRQWADPSSFGSDGSQIQAVITLHQNYLFQAQNDGTYAGQNGTQRLLLPGANALNLVHPDGEVWEFYDMADANLPGRLKSVTSPGGVALSLSYSGGGVAPSEVQRSFTDSQGRAVVGGRCSTVTSRPAIRTRGCWSRCCGSTRWTAARLAGNQPRSLHLLRRWGPVPR